MKTKDPISQQIKESREKRGLTSTQLADILNVPVDRLYKWEHGKASPKYDDRKKIQDWLNGNTENVPGGTSEDQNNMGNMQEIAGKELLKAITTLTESNKGLVDSNKAITDTNKVIADTNALLAQRLVKTTENAGADNPLAHPYVIMKLLETLAELGTGTLWKTKDDGLILLGNRFAVPPGEVKTKGSTHAASGKKSIA